ncbi:MAG: hypothetical protein AB7F40_11870 [Victivallaceae bacterium]|nr:hypothetical protein [Victivallaceae bacterium]
MAYELIYTSAKRGIRIGESGFCTVAHTNGLAANLIPYLEGLSAYKPYFPHYDANAWANPVSFSHCVCEFSGRTLHILSRIGFCGLDHTKRSNKLAHHLVLSVDEAARVSGGPTAVLKQPGLMLSRWDADPMLIPTQKDILRSDIPPRVAREWGKYAGDPGWAGVLAQRFIDAPGKPVFIIFDPQRHTNMLDLMEEALLLLPVGLRWQVSFNTYFTTLPAGTRCNWRCCPPNSDALREARRTPGTMILDLTKPMVKAPGGNLVEAARSGVVVDNPGTGSAPEDEHKKPIRILSAPSSSSGPRMPDFRDKTSSGMLAEERVKMYVIAGLVLAVIILILVLLWRTGAEPTLPPVEDSQAAGSSSVEGSETPGAAGGGHGDGQGASVADEGGGTGQASADGRGALRPPNNEVKAPYDENAFKNLRQKQGKWQFCKLDPSEAVVGVRMVRERDIFPVRNDRAERKAVTGGLTGAVTVDGTAGGKNDFSYELKDAGENIEVVSDDPGVPLQMIITNRRTLFPIELNDRTVIVNLVTENDEPRFKVFSPGVGLVDMKLECGKDFNREFSNLVKYNSESPGSKFAKGLDSLVAKYGKERHDAGTYLETLDKTISDLRVKQIKLSADVKRAWDVVSLSPKEEREAATSKYNSIAREYGIATGDLNRYSEIKQQYEARIRAYNQLINSGNDIKDRCSGDSSGDVEQFNDSVHEESAGWPEPVREEYNQWYSAESRRSEDAVGNMHRALAGQIGGIQQQMLQRDKEGPSNGTGAANY